MLSAQFQIYANYFRPPDGPEFPSPNLGRWFDYQTADGYAFFLNDGPSLLSIGSLIHNPLFDENARHNTNDDYWQARDISQHLHGIHCPVLNVGGWFNAKIWLAPSAPGAPSATSTQASKTSSSWVPGCTVHGRVPTRPASAPST